MYCPPIASSVTTSFDSCVRIRIGANLPKSNSNKSAKHFKRKNRIKNTHSHAHADQDHAHVLAFASSRCIRNKKGLSMSMLSFTDTSNCCQKQSDTAKTQTDLHVLVLLLRLLRSSVTMHLALLFAVDFVADEHQRNHTTTRHD